MVACLKGHNKQDQHRVQYKQEATERKGLASIQSKKPTISTWSDKKKISTFDEDTTKKIQ